MPVEVLRRLPPRPGSSGCSGGGGRSSGGPGGRAGRAARGCAGHRAAVAAAVAAAAPTGRVLASPLARRLADESGLDIRRIAGSGPGGRVVKRDIERARPGTAQASRRRHRRQVEVVAAPQQAPRPPAPMLAGDELVALPMIRRTARAACGGGGQADRAALLSDQRCRRRCAVAVPRNSANQSGQAAGGEKVSVNDMVLKAWPARCASCRRPICRWFPMDSTSSARRRCPASPWRSTKARV